MAQTEVKQVTETQFKTEPELIKLFAEIEEEVKKTHLKRQQFDKSAKVILGGKSEKFIVVEEEVYRISSTGQNCRIEKMTDK